MKDNNNTVYDLTGTELWTMSIGHVFMMWVDTHEETILYIWDVAAFKHLFRWYGMPVHIKVDTVKHG